MTCFFVTLGVVMIVIGTIQPAREKADSQLPDLDSNQQMAQDQDEPAVLRVRIQYPGASTGRLRLAVFTSGDGFPQIGAASQKVSADLSTNPVSLDCPVAERLAVAVFLDANDDGMLNKNSLGIPVEPYGFSNDARRTFGPPRFADAAVAWPRDDEPLTIYLR